MNTKNLLQRAKIGLLLDQPFFGTLLLNLAIREDNIETAEVDGQTLKYNPTWIEKLGGEKHLGTVLAHEVLHCGLTHHLRRGERDHEDWNKACDHAVNLILDQANELANTKGKAQPFPWPTNCEVLKESCFAGKSVEEIYDILHAQKMPQDQPGNNPGKGKPGLGEVNDGPGEQDQSGQQEQEAKWRVAMVQAASIAKAQGTLPDDLARLIEEIIHPSQSWQELLREFVREKCQDDYSWTRPNSRYLHTGFILPSLYSQRLGPIAVAIDTSGSIEDQLLNSFLSEVEVLMHECRPTKVLLIDCDARVNSVRELEPSDPLPRDFSGGGGTDFRPVFRSLENQDIVCLIYLTDLYGTFPDQLPSYPVIWGSTSDKQAPFGQTITVADCQSAILSFSNYANEKKR